MNPQGVWRRVSDAVTGRPDLEELERLKHRVELLGAGVAEELQLRPLTRADLDDLVERVADVAARELAKHRRED